VKFLVLLVFSIIVLSLPKTSFSILVCYAVGPFAILVIGKVPLSFAFKQVLLVSPFVLVLALTCPFYDREPASAAFGPFVWQISVGWLRCFVILGKFIVAMLALIGLVSTTRFSVLLAGLGRLGFPKLLIIQLGFLYRYIFVLIDKAHHILRARRARSLRNLGFKKELSVASSMVGSLFIRSIDSAEHINFAMQSRGFDGRWRTLIRHRIRWQDLLFAAAASAFIFGVYFFIRPILR
jgi:cobalt/nickel transport system permease protein